MAFTLSVTTILFIYVLGGVTLIPITIVAFFFLLPNKTLEDTNKAEKSIIDPDLKLGDINELKNLKVTKQGLISIVSKYDSTILNGKKDTSGLANLGVDLNTYNKLKNNSIYFVNLVHGNLLLYSQTTTENNIKEDESNSLNTIKNPIDLRKILKVISLKDTIVTMWPPNLTEGSLFTKKSSILIIKKNLFDPNTNKFNLPINLNSFIDNNIFFLKPENNFEKEDWYFTLLNAVKGLNANSEPFTGYIQNFGKFAQEPPETYHFNTADVHKLIALNNSNIDHINCKWFNLILGRLFLAYKANGKLEHNITQKIKDKLSKINVSFLDEFAIKDLQLGDAPPIISNPEIVRMNLEGDLEIHFNLLFDSDFILHISTLITLLNKTYPVELKLDLKKIQGTMILIFKKPPSNRIWYTFSKIPLLDLEIEPVIVNKSFSYGMIVKTLKNKIIDVLKESLVYPYFEDLNYYNIENNTSIYKGGLWDFSNLKTYMEDFVPESNFNYVSESDSNARSSHDENVRSFEKSDNSNNNNDDQINIDELNDVENTYSSATNNNSNVDKKSFRDLLKKRTTNMIPPVSQVGLTEADLASVSSNESTNNKKYSTKINTWYKKAKKSASTMIDDIKSENDSERSTKETEADDESHQTTDEVLENEDIFTGESLKHVSSKKSEKSEKSYESEKRKEVLQPHLEQEEPIIDEEINPFDQYQKIKNEQLNIQQKTKTTIINKRRPLPPIPTGKLPIPEVIIPKQDLVEKMEEAAVIDPETDIKEEKLKTNQEEN